MTEALILTALKCSFGAAVVGGFFWILSRPKADAKRIKTGQEQVIAAERAADAGHPKDLDELP